MKNKMIMALNCANQETMSLLIQLRDEVLNLSNLIVNKIDFGKFLMKNSRQRQWNS